MSPYLLEVEHLKKYFVLKKSFGTPKTLKAVEDITFAVKKGECFGIVGESGCGKSTAGRTVLQLLTPTAGKITFNQRIIYDDKNHVKLQRKEWLELRKDMQIIFQDPYASLDPRMTVEKIVTEGILKHKIMVSNEATDYAADILAQCGLTKDALRRYPHEFSGGQRQRIGIARALALAPQLVVCDEPIAALDVSIQAQVLNLMKNLKEQMGLTYIFISHDLQVVHYFCDIIAVMYLGNIVELGESKSLFKRPLHPYTKSLLLSIPKEHPCIKKEPLTIKGEIPTPINPPAGCVFHTRCPYATPICQTEKPQMAEAEKDHQVACHHWEKVSS